MKTLTITDETAAGDILNTIALKFNEEYITVKQLITARLQEEVKRYETNINDYKGNLVRPTNIEQRLNNKKTKVIDVEKQQYVALKAFKNNGFIVLVDNEQVESLEQKFLVEETTQVSFLKLTPLVGG